MRGTVPNRCLPRSRRKRCAWFDEERVLADERQTRRVALLRYEGQGSEIAITWQSDAQAAFAEAHRALNGFALEANIELVTLRVEAEGRVPIPARPMLPPAKGAVPFGRQVVHDAGGTIEASVYDRSMLGAGDRMTGPAVVTQLDATTLVAREWYAEVLTSGALLLRRA